MATHDNAIPIKEHQDQVHEFTTGSWEQRTHREYMEALARIEGLLSRILNATQRSSK